MKKKNILFSKLFLMVLSMFAVKQSLASANFTIFPTPGLPRPTQVLQGSIVSAFYTVTNQTNSSRTGYRVQGMPATVRQNTSNQSYCQNPISLAAHASCILQLDISGMAKSSFALCKGSSCTTTAVPLNVSLITLPSITLETIPVNSELPSLRDPVVANHGDNWLIVSGTTGNFHQFENTYFISSIYVYNPSTMQLYSMSISNTNLPTAVKNQLASSNVEFLEDGDTLYIIGGFWTPDNLHWSTLNTITAIDIPGMIHAIINNNTNLASYVNYTTSIPQFQVTGGQLGKIGNDFYLTFGMNCYGSNYCGGPGGGQIYTNSIYQFSTDPILSSISIINTATHADNDNSGWRRRDYTLVPFMLGNTETLLVEGGPFTQPTNPNPGEVWTNGINFNGDLQANNSFINQQANQYLAPSLSMYSASRKVSYTATFSGLSNLYWSTTGLVHDATTPYGNILDLISYNTNETVHEYANTKPICSGQPVASCLYMGLTSIFIPVSNYNYFDGRHILQLDRLPKNTKTLVGYLYAGLLSPDQKIFTSIPPPKGPSYTTNRVYAVYVVPSGAGSGVWNNITNLYPGIPNDLQSATAPLS